MLAIRVDQPGGPEVLKAVQVPEPTLQPGQLLVDARTLGVNFIDINFRRGINARGNDPVAMPFIPGDEGVGIIRAVGDGVAGFSVGDRVAWIFADAGYAEVVAVPAKFAVKVPEGLPDEIGLVLAQGLAAHYLVHDIVKVDSRTTALVHAAAGGVGRLLTQILKIRGARVLGAVSSPAKTALVRAAGADEVMLYSDYSDADFAAKVRALTDGKGVDVVYDGTGKDTFERSLASIRRRGHFVAFGAASGVAMIDPRALLRAGSISFIRPGLRDFIQPWEVLQSRADDLFAWIKDGRLAVEIGGRFALNDAAEAHRAMESRMTTGKLILTVAPAQASVQ